MRLNSPYVVELSRIDKIDESLVGKKAHDLGELWRLGIPFPNGFVITTKFYKEFLRLTKIDKEIEKVQVLNHPAIADSIDKLFYPIQKQIMHQEIPLILVTELHKFYRKLSGILKERTLSISSSSFNNKSIVFPDVLGDTNLILKIKTIWSMSPAEQIAIVVQENIQTQIKDKILTDNLIIDKKLEKRKMDELINYCKIIQKYFYFPYEIEYAVKKDKIFITNLKPFTGIVDEFSKQILNNKTQKVLVKGVSINPGIVTGPVEILQNIYSDSEIKKGNVVVLSNLQPSLFGRIKKAKAVVVDSIISNPLDRVLYRTDFQIPTVEGVKDAAKILRNGNIVTVNGASGEIYSGGLIY